jgi:nucleoside-diphosphate-sugar epimerase
MAAGKGVRRFLYLSSVKANGEGAPEPYSERDTPAPVDLYGKTKLEAEEALRRIASATRMELVILRPPLVYGPNVRANFLRLMELVYRGIPLPLGSIRNRRSMIYLGNLVHAVLTCINHAKAAGETFLVSDGQDVSTTDLIRMLAAAMGRKHRLFPFPPELLEIIGKITGTTGELVKLTGSLNIDSGKIGRLLNWQPPFTLDEGLRETVAWYKGR